MAVDYEKLARQARLMAELEMGWDELKPTLVSCYGSLADVQCNGGVNDGIIRNNVETYNILLNRDVLGFVYQKFTDGELNDDIANNPTLGTIFYDNSIWTLAKTYDYIDTSSIVTGFNDVKKAISTFGLVAITDADIDLDLDDDGTEDDIPDGFFDDIDIGGVGDTGSEPASGPDTTDDPDDDVFDVSDIMGTGGNADPAADTPDTPDTYPDDEPVNVDKEEALKKMKEAWGGKLANVLTGIMAAYRELYASGYGVVYPSGILTNQGIFKSYKDGSSKLTGDRATDIELFNAIVSATGDQFVNFSAPGQELDIHNLINCNYPITAVDMHLRYMFGHFRYCKGENSIRRYFRENNISNNGDDTKAIKWGDMSRYIKDNLERTFYNAYIQMGITDSIDQQSIDLVNTINTKLSASLKNVIAVVERKKNVNTRLRICTDNTNLSSKAIIDSLTSAMNIGSASTVLVKDMGGSDGVIDINVIYNNKVYSQDQLFAHQVLNDILEQGIKPAWDNVILGKKDDGTIMTYNFKDTTNPIYGLYAGSRAGKGVMTLNLLASALADGCKLAYIDGKPEMANVIADIAWKNGVDAFAFNGLDVNSNKGLENRGNCIRQIDRFYDAGSIPSDIFVTEDDKVVFMMTVHYLRAVEIVMKMAKERMDNCKPNDWMVAVFDECEQFAAQESRVNSLLDKAYERRKKAIDPNDPKGTKKISVTKDPAAIFIDNYRMWCSKLESEFVTCVKSAFGKGNMTLFFVWQSSKFPNEYKGKSTLANMAISARAKMVKIVGRGAVEQGGSTDFGNATSLKEMPWYDERFSGKNGGFFAIGSSLTTPNSMTVFRPFNIYSDANGRDLIITNAKASGLTEADLYGVTLREDGSVIPEVGFEGYATKLLGSHGITLHEQINIGFNYADAYAKSLGFNGLLEYIYSVSAFSGEAPVKAEGYTAGFDAAAMSRGQNLGDNYDDEDGDPLDFGGNDPISQNPPRPDNPTNQPHGSPWAGSTGTTSTADAEMLRRAREQAELERRRREQSAAAARGGNTPGGQFQPGAGNPPGGQFQPGTQQGGNNPGYFDADDLSRYGEQFSGEDSAPEGYVQTPNGGYANPSAELISTKHNSAYRMGSPSEGGYTFITPSRVSKIMNLTKENSVIVTVSDHRSPKASAKLFRTLRGAKYEMKSRWESILNTVANQQNPATIHTVTIFNDALVFNRRQIAAMGLIGGSDGVEVRDIVNFKALNKTFKNIRKLSIDTEVYNAALVEFPDDPASALFGLFKNLQELSIWKPGYGEPPVSYTRQSINSAEAQKNIEMAKQRAQLQNSIDTIAAANNPRYKSMDPINKYRIHQKSVNLTRNGWETCKKSFKEDKWTKGTVAFAFTALTLGPSLLLTGASKLFKGGKR